MYGSRFDTTNRAGLGIFEKNRQAFCQLKDGLAGAWPLRYAPGMSTPEVSPRGSRETRLLLVTIAVSVGVLLLLARYRFPDDPAIHPVESAPAPLERLAARAAYDELASIMADLERRIAPRVTIVRTQSNAGGTTMLVAPRMVPDRVVAVVPAEEAIVGGGTAGAPEVISQDYAAQLAVLKVPAVEDGIVQVRQLPPRIGPRYLAVVEATALGPTITPVYVGRVDSFQDPHSGAPLLSLAGLQRELRPGAAIFTLEGQLVGLVRASGGTITVVPGETLRSIASSAQPQAPVRGDLGVEVDALTAALARGTGAQHGVIVAYVRPEGSAAAALRVGDVVHSVDGTAITRPEQFRDIASRKAPGATVVIDAIRERKPLQASIVAGDGVAAKAVDELGLVGRSVPGLGIEVVAVREGSAAARAGLRRGDLVVAVDGRSDTNAAQLARRFRSADPSSVIVLAVQRGELHRILPLEKP
jgi:S1-C subfamily serine protease